MSKQHVQALHNTFVREKIDTEMLNIIRGPLVTTYRIRVVNPTSGIVGRVLALGTTLQAALNVEAARITQVAGYIEIQIPNAEPITPNGTAMRKASNGLNVAVGWDAYGKPLSVDLAHHGAVAWVGPSRRGKTQSMRATLYALAAGYGQALRYVIVCQQSKLHDWQVFSQSIHSAGIVTQAADITKAIQFFENRVRTGRGQFEYIVLIDDLPSILMMTDIAKPIATIASVGAGVGVHLLIGTQELGSKAGSGGGLVENNITARVIYKPASKSTGARNAGSGGLGTDALSSAKGDAILSIDGHAERIATAMANDNEIMKLPRITGGSKLEPLAVTEPVQAVLSGSMGGSVTGSKVVLGGSTRVEGVYQPVTGSSGSIGSKTFDIDTFSLPTSRDPNRVELSLIYAVYQKLGSKNATLKQIWNGKNGKTLAWLDAAIAANQPDDNKIINMEKRRVAHV